MKHTLFMSMLAALVVFSLGFISFFFLEDLGNIISGRTITQVYVRGADEASCSVELIEGVNLASFYCEPGTRSVNEVMMDASDQRLQYYAVFSYVNDANDYWKSYNPSLPNWTNQDLSTIDWRLGYVVIMNETGSYTNTDGLKFPVTRISLVKGWNLVGYPTDMSRNVSEALAQLNGKYELVETENPINHALVISYAPGIGGELEIMHPMEGYWILMNESAQWVVDW